MTERLFTYLNRQWIKANIAAEVPDSETLSKWSYDMSIKEGRMKATRCARAADPSSVIPSLALRRFRTELVEPLFNSTEFLKKLHGVVASDAVIQDEGTIRKLLEICRNINVEPSYPVLQNFRLFLEKSSEAKGQLADTKMNQEEFQSVFNRGLIESAIRLVLALFILDSPSSRTSKYSADPPAAVPIYETWGSWQSSACTHNFHLRPSSTLPLMDDFVELSFGLAQDRTPQSKAAESWTMDGGCIVS
ncbi:hypothetical protein IW261DRAFT_1588858 [Armillaria novae-zelandiae]|uniref:Uncharacterized protein n=1 Tax=Armillaria novae-zelandiae TaxID=153914 RepID=A0AA39PQ73_9AGAR|nr:hypothetical protein IW261DRAFT_1588858 [Armillaria novae-zelandiae]